MTIEMLMPRLSDTMEEGKILKWLKKVGEKIEVGDIFAEVETDKADMEMEALDAGVLAEIRVQEGESVPVNAVIAMLSTEGEVQVAETPARQEGAVPKVPVSVPPAPPKPVVPVTVEAPASPEPVARPSLPQSDRKVRELREPRARRAAPEAKETQERIFASPLVKRMAQEQGIDLEAVHGSGPGGRIVKQDLDVYAGQGRTTMKQAPATRAPQPEEAPQPSPAVRGTREVFSRMRATIAKRMADSMREAPHFYVTVEIDMSEAVRLRAALKSSDRVKADVTYTHVLVKAVAIALQRHPRLNAAFVEGGRELKADINIGLAVSLDDGLLVPVLHNCDRLSLLDIAEQANGLVERARTGKPTSEDLSGGTFTISNMGMLPVEHFTAIINPPQGAILAVGAIKERPVVRNGEIRAAHTMMATLSCDHRILDGVTGGQFLAELKNLLENPVGLMV
ncbi:MAG: 2-oxo acid dehydrogenase subunit E2 [Deltaproteobacteria bacterium]|nr:2-oxo acid dehydrogenase subunit E2 [Deltaproteobacteria bacterium]